LKRIKSYSNVWNIEKVLYSINDINLPFSFTFTQIGWFCGAFVITLMLADMPPLSLVDGALIKHVVIPVGTAWFFSQKTFDGKKPYSFLKSFFAYCLRPKATYAGKPVRLRKIKINERITAVRSEIYEPEPAD